MDWTVSTSDALSPARREALRALWQRAFDQRWQGPSITATADGVVADDEHGGLMVRRRDPAELPDLALDVVCEDRAGDAW